MWGWCQDTAMYWWMALGSLFWGVVVVGIIFALDRVFTGRPGRRSGARLPVSAGTQPGDDDAEISEEQIERIRDRLLH